MKTAFIMFFFNVDNLKNRLRGMKESSVAEWSRYTWSEGETVFVAENREMREIRLQPLHPVGGGCTTKESGSSTPERDSIRYSFLFRYLWDRLPRGWPRGLLAPRPPSLLPAATAELRATPLCEIIKIPTMQIFGGGRSRRPARGFPVSVPRPLRPGAKILIKSLARGRRSGPAGRFFNWPPFGELA